MNMEVMIPTPAVDFNFESACTTPFTSAPSSPQPFGTCFFSAPTSPTRISSIYNDFNSFQNGGNHHLANDSVSSVPFDWEEKPGTPKSKGNFNFNDDVEKDFAFDFSGKIGIMDPLTADELFDGGKIKPLKPPPCLLADCSSPRSPRSPKQFIKETFSPRHRKKDIDPFAVAIEQSRKECVISAQKPPIDRQERGRERNSSNKSRKKGGRSLSPFKVSNLLVDHDHQNMIENPGKDDDDSNSFFALFWHSKWKLKDLLLFRSASEGHANSKDQLKKYAMLKNTTHHQQENVKNSSFRSNDSTGSGSGSSSRRRGPPVSAHELHYKANRAMTGELRRKTSLPYKTGLFGCLGFRTRGVPINDISHRGFGSSMPREQRC